MSKKELPKAPEVKKPEPKELYKEDLQEQLASCEQQIAQMNQQMSQLQNAINQERGIAEHARFMLSKYRLPSRPKPELEVAK